MGCSLQLYRCVVGLFVNTLQKILTRKAKIAAARVRGLRVEKFSGKLAVTCLLLMMLIGCVEPNPGPPPSPPPPHTATTAAAALFVTENNNISGGDSNMQHQSVFPEMEATQLLYGLSESVQSLTGVVRRLEEGQQQLSDSMNQKLGNIQSTLNDKLNQLGEEQEVLRLDLDELCDKQERVEEDTAALKETVQQLTSKLEWLDAERRKSNLLFFGVASRAGASCEQLILEVLRDKLNMTADIIIEYAHWTGNAILVRFQSLKQRGMVLTQARQLSASSKLSIREDFSKEVSNRRKGLVGMYKQLRSDGKRATLKADRLYTDDGVYTFNTERREIITVGTASNRRQRAKTDAHGAGGSGDAAASANHITNNNITERGDDGSVEDVSMEGCADSGTGGGVERPLAPKHLHSTRHEDRQSALGGGRHSGDHQRGWQFNTPSRDRQPLVQHGERHSSSQRDSGQSSTQCNGQVPSSSGAGEPRPEVNNADQSARPNGATFMTPDQLGTVTPTHSQQLHKQTPHTSQHTETSVSKNSS